MRIVIVSFVAALLAIAARPAAADVFNQRNHLVGLRATLMGGAYTAIADDISAAEALARFSAEPAPTRRRTPWRPSTSVSDSVPADWRATCGSPPTGSRS